MKAILKRSFSTELGNINSWVENTDCDITIINHNQVQTKGHLITLQAFGITNKWLPDPMHVRSMWVWRWYIEKICDYTEELFIYCQLVNPSALTSFGSAGGQYLDVIEICDSISVLHIGTEDGEIMQGRAEKSDLMPNRFKNYLNDFRSFTKHIDYGFKVETPNLRLEEKIYFHFIVATDSIKPSKYHPDEEDISTWLAVDQSKLFLDKISTEKDI